MLGEYRVSRCTRQCFSLKRPLAEGEWYYSVVMESGDDFIRHDYSLESWQGPPEGAIGWWKNRMPRSDEKRLVLAPPEVLIDLLRQMAAFPEKAKTRYLLALMLMRKRLIRPASNPLEQTMCVEVVADGSTIEVETVSITKSEAETLRLELNDLLYCEAEVIE
ncbi:hypothetical protein Q31b_00230 [Novipirellula aureliae]|uniref:Uncharacterized protein n=1 Tax=Novipirellula aureliae TaxID=2527966 RepID=A0A5C6E587_9BACT|nr:hypothetical protein [Novipirellula aureliae]TWU44853.1 hypothetical protein Q31b_00230 [Novipirellula aureliae]